MYHLVIVDHNSMAAHLTRSDCEGPKPVDRTDDGMLCNDNEGDGDISIWVWGKWRHWLWKWRQWHWLVKVDRILYALCIKCMKLIVKYFFLADVLFLGGHLRFG
jgi:hypothetical protein